MSSRNILKIGSNTAMLAILCLLTACSSQPSYVIDHSEKFDFSQLKTYRWYDDVYTSAASEYRHYNSSDKRIRSYVDRELTQKGLRERHSGTGDFLVNYNISKQEHVSIDNFSNYPPGMHGGVGVGNYGSAVVVGYSNSSNVKVYKEGTVVIDVIDAQSKKVVWRGIAEARMKKSMSQQDKDHIASEISRELLTDFPPTTSPR